MSCCSAVAVLTARVSVSVTDGLWHFVEDFAQQFAYNCLQLFIVYYSNNLSFADDTTIILSAKNNNLLFQKGNKELENIDNWLIANKLSLNVKKTKYILFSSRTTKTLSKDSVLTIRKNQIERVTSVKLLGVIFNERLT